VADLLAALDQYPVRPTVSVAVDRLLSEGVPEDIRTLLCQAVSRWTACEPGESPGADRAAWERWWSGVRALDDAGWNAELARNFRARAERAVADREALEARVLDLYNALYAASPGERRGHVIATMLQDDLAKARRLGLELASRTLLNAQPLGPDVASAAAALLQCAHEDIRASAARLMENLGALSDHAAIAEALANESSPRVAGPLLRLSSRAPGAVPTGVLLRWLAAPEPAGSAAAEAVLAVRSADLLPEAAARDALSTVLGLDPAQMTGAQARLL